MNRPTITRWIDIESDDFKRTENSAFTYRFVLRGLEIGATHVNSKGHIIANGEPTYTELDGEVVGLLCLAKASN